MAARGMQGQGQSSHGVDQGHVGFHLSRVPHQPSTALTATVAQLQTEATYPHPPESHAQQVQELQDHTTQADDNVAKLHKEIRYVHIRADDTPMHTAVPARFWRATCCSWLSEKGASKRRKIHCRRKSPRWSHDSGRQAAFLVHLTVDPHRHLLSLYAHITKITWHYERSDRVAGTVSNPARGDIQLFDIDPASMSEASLVNALWDKLPC